MDGSFINTRPLWEIVTYDLSEFVGRRLASESRMQCVGSTLQGTLSVCVDHAGRTLDDELFSSDSQLTENRFTGLVLEYGVERRLGVPKILDQTRAADTPVVLVTNIRRHVAQPYTDAMGEHHFIATACSDEMANGESAPDPYLRGAELAGLAPEDYPVVEDSSAGVCSALVTDCTVVWSPIPGASVSQADMETLIPPARPISSNLDTLNLSLLWTTLTGEQTTWNNRSSEEL